MVTDCHVISLPGLCRALGVNSCQETAQMWTLKVASSLANLQTGSIWTTVLPECIVNTCDHKSQSSTTCGWAGARRKQQNGAPADHHHSHEEDSRRGTQGYLVATSQDFLPFWRLGELSHCRVRIQKGHQGKNLDQDKTEPTRQRPVTSSWAEAW